MKKPKIYYEYPDTTCNCCVGPDGKHLVPSLGDADILALKLYGKYIRGISFDSNDWRWEGTSVAFGTEGQEADWHCHGVGVSIAEVILQMVAQIKEYKRSR